MISISGTNNLFLVLCLAVCIECSFGHSLHAQVKTEPTSQTTTIDKFAFDAADHRNDPKRGFAAGLRLIRMAEKEHSPPETVARLYYNTARIRISLVHLKNTVEPPMIDDVMARPAITMLNKVLKHPDRFLVNEESAKWYTNCVNLLINIYQNKGDSRAEFEKAIGFALAAIEASNSLDETRKMVASADIRLGCSDTALHDEDWDAAIAWLKPTIDSADRFLVDGKSMATLSMTVRQQSMFLVEKKLWNKSADLIDNMCETFEKAKSIKEHDRLRALCMLRGKMLSNFGNNMDHPRAIEGIVKYELLSKRADNYEGPDKELVLWYAMNMDRLAASCIFDQDGDKAIAAVNHAFDTVEENIDLLTPKSTAVFHALDASKAVMRKLPREDPRRIKLKQRAVSLIELLLKKGVAEEQLERFR